MIKPVLLFLVVLCLFLGFTIVPSDVLWAYARKLKRFVIPVVLAIVATLALLHFSFNFQWSIF